MTKKSPLNKKATGAQSEAYKLELVLERLREKELEYSTLVGDVYDGMFLVEG